MAVDRHGRRIPPFRETQDYVRKVGLGAGGTNTTEVVASNRLVIYKTFEIVDGRAVPRYSSRKPATGTYEVVVQ